VAEPEDTFVAVIKAQRNAALDANAILEGRCAKLRADLTKANETIEARDKELEATVQRLTALEKNVAPPASRRRAPRKTK
jgi:hypothetical protein